MTKALILQIKNENYKFKTLELRFFRNLIKITIFVCYSDKTIQQWRL